MKGNDILEKLEFLLERGTISTDVEKNLAKGHVPLIGMKYKKRRKFNKLTGTYIIVHEEEEVEESCGKDHSKDKKKKKTKKEEYEPKSRFGKLLTERK